MKQERAVFPLALAAAVLVVGVSCQDAPQSDGIDPREALPMATPFVDTLVQPDSIMARDTARAP